VKYKSHWSFTFCDAAIDFDRVKYKFTAVECVDEKINGWGLISLHYLIRFEYK
jgi:hypothetical protein